MFRAFIDTSFVGDQRWEHRWSTQMGTPFCQAIFQGVEGPEWEAVFYPYKNLHQAVKSKKAGHNKKANVPWAMQEAKERGVDYYDPNHKNKFGRELNSG